MMKAQHVIWSNYDLDYERDWKGLLEEEYPERKKSVSCSCTR